MSDQTKECRICGEEKPLSKYYKHPGMADGHLNACKECKRKKQRENYHENTQDPEWVEKERKRTRERYHRLNYGEKYAWENLSEEQRQAQIEAQRKYRRRRKEVVAAHNYVNKHMDIPDDKDAHHWSYREEHRNDVIVLDPDVHKRLHRFLEYDEDEKMYRGPDGNLLTCKEEHKRLIRAKEWVTNPKV